MSETTEDTGALAALMAKPQVEHIAGVPVVFTPPGHRAELHEELLEKPRRVRSQIKAYDVQGFIDYVNKHKLPVTALYSTSRDDPKLLARIDDHEPQGEPSHVTHVCHFGCPRTVEWLAWTRACSERMAQVEFAEFVENNIRDIIEPAGAEMLQMVLSFQDTGKAEFSSAVRLSDGRVQFKFMEKETGGEVQFPRRLKLGVPVFEGLKQRYTLEAKLRYRIREGGLTIWFELDRPDLVLKAAYEDMLILVAKETSLPVLKAI